MRFQTLVSLSTVSLSIFIAKVNGAPYSRDLTVDWDVHPWMAPGPDDLRSPCPGLNALANHGFLPRDGKGLNVSVVLDAALEGFNIQPEVLTAAAKLGLLTSNDPLSFTLDDLKVHGVIEHDTSLSRQDIALGDNLHFNEEIFSTLANANPGKDFYDVNSAGEVMFQRLQQDIVANPNITNTAKIAAMRSGESALYLSTMGDASTGKAPKNFVQILFREERLPVAEGWQRSSTPIDGETLNGLLNSIMMASNWTSSGECESPASIV
ncbi:hypothetical protein VKT23_000328 [Stygiomarasmius scandens]|uniref:Heme haloperoxidase family profile domain-containing protein n=1 Tax=Marasmiellus scandens TaxID=2682957 RepID=A0ABR1K5N1_9AGAR